MLNTYIILHINIYIGISKNRFYIWSVVIDLCRLINVFIITHGRCEGERRNGVLGDVLIDQRRAPQLDSSLPSGEIRQNIAVRMSWRYKFHNTSVYHQFFPIDMSVNDQLEHPFLVGNIHCMVHHSVIIIHAYYSHFAPCIKTDISNSTYPEETNKPVNW